MNELAASKCVPCRVGVPPLDEAGIAELAPQAPDWEIRLVDGVPHLERRFKFKDFARALAFSNRVGQIAEAEDHHPALLTEWGAVTVSWWTHSINGLHRNDFIMAAKTDVLFEGQA